MDPLDVLRRLQVGWRALSILRFDPNVTVRSPYQPAGGEEMTEPDEERDSDSIVLWDPSPEEDLLLSVFVPHFGPALAQYRRDVKARRVNHLAEQIEKYLSSSRLTLEDFLIRVRDEPRLTDLLEEAVQVAASSGLEAKRIAMGKVLIAAAADARIDEAQVLLNTLGQVEAPHIRLLDAISYQVPLERAELHERFEESVYSVVDGLIAVLLSQGLIRDAGAGTYDGKPSFQRTEFGNLLLEYLANTEV